MKKQTRKNLEYLIKNLSTIKIKDLVKSLEKNEITIKSTEYQLTKKLSLTSSEVEIVKDVFNEFKNTSELATAILLLDEIKKLQHEKIISTSLVWTSPILFHEHADKTDQTITDLLLKAHTSITIVGYAMTSDKHVKEVFSILQKNSRINKIDVKFIFDKAGEKKVHGKKQPSVKKIIRNNWDSDITFPKIYTYDDGLKSSLHAKVLIIDSKEILITSANMTGRGMTRNLEMGVRHTGKAAAEAEELIAALISNKIIKQI